MTKQDKAEFKAYCQGVTEAQLREVHLKEVRAYRSDYAALARQELQRRGLA